MQQIYLAEPWALLFAKPGAGTALLKVLQLAYGFSNNCKLHYGLLNAASNLWLALPAAQQKHMYNGTVLPSLVVAFSSRTLARLTPGRAGLIGCNCSTASQVS